MPVEKCENITGSINLWHFYESFSGRVILSTMKGICQKRRSGGGEKVYTIDMSKQRILIRFRTHHEGGKRNSPCPLLSKDGVHKLHLLLRAE